MFVPNLLSVYFWDHPSFCSNRENIDSWEIVDCSWSFLTSSGNLVDWSGSCYHIYNRSNNFHTERFVNLTTIGGSWYFDRAVVPQRLELVSKELNHLAAILHVYAGGLNFRK